MNQKQLKVEMGRLRQIIFAAAEKAKQPAVTDKLTAALLRIELLIKKLRRPARRTTRR